MTGRNRLVDEVVVPVEVTAEVVDEPVSSALVPILRQDQDGESPLPG